MVQSSVTKSLYDIPNHLWDVRSGIDEKVDYIFEMNLVLSDLSVFACRVTLFFDPKKIVGNFLHIMV